MTRCSKRKRHRDAHRDHNQKKKIQKKRGNHNSDVIEIRSSLNFINHNRNHGGSKDEISDRKREKSFETQSNGECSVVKRLHNYFQNIVKYDFDSSDSESSSMDGATTGLIMGHKSRRRSIPSLPSSPIHKCRSPKISKIQRKRYGTVAIGYIKDMVLNNLCKIVNKVKSIW